MAIYLQIYWGFGMCFNIGKDRVQAFVDYVIENCEGYRIVYVNNDNDANPIDNN